MMRTKKGATAVALGAVVAVTAAACSSSGGGSTTSPSSAAEGAKGGTLTMLNLGPTEHLDPQRVYIGADIQFASRTYARTLTTYSPGKDAKLVPDLATDMGTMSDQGKTWKFTLGDTAKWQDGKPVTCADLKYGVSRTFAQDVITGGPNYMITFLDIPTKKDDKGNDVSAYAGPYTKDGQDLFDKAVTCDGQTITFKFSKPWADFNVQTAALLAVAPFRQDQDKGDKSDFTPFSDGPYMLEGTYDPNKGGKWVRNPNWDAGSDKVRKALPDIIQYTNGVQTETIFQRLIANSGDDKNAISAIQATPSTLPQLAGSPDAVKRSATVPAPYTDYVQPNFKSKVMSNEKVRQAFAMSTNRDAYVTAYGGSQAETPTYAMCNPTLKCFKKFNPFNAPTAGDPDAAKKVLADAGVATPVAITVAYRKRPTADKAFAAMKETWDKAGFNVTLEGITDKYYATIQGPAYATRDVFWAGWGADWPSGSAVLPPLFDGRVNISAGGSGQDYGYFNDDEVNKAIDAAYLIADADAREKAWGDIDEMISKKGGVIPLINQKFTFAWGSNVKNFETNPLMGGYVDLANISVK
ncbi:ABC transporter substrate-binding protein [Lapillicoccus sp.]|uniref:ABC transporter substrate-binding protein n=1 Tax=Lapillicoccus sp. TaxID=1909287 RepID=UPI0032650014